MRTLHLRLERHPESALRVVSWFQGQDCVAGVLHPALPDHPGHATWARDAEGTNGLLSVVFHDDFPVETFLDSLALFVVGSSWGGFESLFKTFELPERLRAQYARKVGTAVRFLVVLEHVDVLLEDLEQALSSVG